MSKIIVSPSILSADFSNVSEGLEDVKKSMAPWVHLDVMDGVFVPNMSFGPKFVSDMRKKSDLFFDTHLMIVEPQNFVKQFADAGSQAITVHAEACTHLDRTLNLIKSCGCKAGVAVCPSTPVSSLECILDIADIVLIMSVNPGFGGQSLIPYTLEKIKKLVQIRGSREYLISVDGGVNDKTIEDVRKSGADVVVAGSAFFASSDKAGLVKRYAG